MCEGDGTQPVGRGIGPALEARDVLSVLRREASAPADLRERALFLAARVIEIGRELAPGLGIDVARALLDEGHALRKFEAICEAQGGMRIPSIAPLTHTIEATESGRLLAIDNRRLARAAKLAGAPVAAAAGLELLVRVGDTISVKQPLFVLHAETPGELDYSLEFVRANPDILKIGTPDE